MATPLEYHIQQFHSLNRPFAFAQQLQDASRWWLLAVERNGDDINAMVLEQLIAWLPDSTAEWIPHHQLVPLDEVVQLAGNHLVAFPLNNRHRTTTLSLTLCLQISCFPPNLLPAPTLWRQSPIPLKTSSLGPVSSSPSESLTFPSQTGFSRARQGIREARQSQHQCQMMEVGALAWSPDVPQAALIKLGNSVRFIMVSIQGGTQHKLVVKVRCVHGYVHGYSLVRYGPHRPMNPAAWGHRFVLVSVQHRRKQHNRKLGGMGHFECLSRCMYTFGLNCTFFLLFW